MQTDFSAVTKHCCTLQYVARPNAINSAGGILVCLQRSCSYEPPLGTSGPHMSSSSTYLLPPHCYYCSLSNLAMFSREKKRHGSLNRCFSSATVFILSTAPNAQCVVICPIPSPFMDLQYSMTRSELY